MSHYAYYTPRALVEEFIVLVSAGHTGSELFVELKTEILTRLQRAGEPLTIAELQSCRGEDFVTEPPEISEPPDPTLHLLRPAGLPDMRPAGLPDNLLGEAEFAASAHHNDCGDGGP